MGAILWAAVLSCAVFTPQTARASSPNLCENLFVSQPSFADVYTHRNSGLTARGFISAFPALNDTLKSEATRTGLMWWALRIYVAKNQAEAEAHWRSISNPMLRGVYLLDPGARVDLAKAQGPDVFRTLYDESGLIEFQPKPGDATQGLVAVRVPDSFVRTNMNPDAIELWLDEGVPFMTQDGWVYTKMRGVVLTHETANSKTYKTIRSLARKLYREGWRVTFNHNFVESLNQVRDQLRYVDGVWQANSRYQNKALYDAAIEGFKKGSAFSAEFRDPDGRLAGSVIGEIHGRLYLGESVSYDGVTYPQLTLNLAKIPFVALQDRLQEAGIEMIDAGMVSDFTASLRGRYIDRADFDQRVRELQQTPHIKTPDFTTPYVPRGME